MNVRNAIHLKIVQLHRFLIIGPVLTGICVVLIFLYLSNIPADASDKLVIDTVLLVRASSSFLELWWIFLDFCVFYDRGESEITRQYTKKVLLTWNLLSTICLYVTLAGIWLKTESISHLCRGICLKQSILLMLLRLIVSVLLNCFRLPIALSVSTFFVILSYIIA